MKNDEQELLEDARLQLNSSESDQKLTDDQLICECMCINVGTIREKIIGKDLSLAFLSEELGLGSGCSSCLKDFKYWKDKI